MPDEADVPEERTVRSDWGFSLDELFQHAMNYYKQAKPIISLSYHDKLLLSAHWKQAVYGGFDPTQAPALGYLDVIGNDRRAAWIKLGDMPRDEAKHLLVEMMLKQSPPFSTWLDAQWCSRLEEIRAKEEEEAAALAEAERIAEEAQRRVMEEERKRQEMEIQLSVEKELQRNTGSENSIQQEDEMKTTVQASHQNETIPNGITSNQMFQVKSASLWTRTKVSEFVDQVKVDPNSVLVVGRGENLTIKVPTHPSGNCLFFELATDSYDIGFGMQFQFSKTSVPSQSVSSERKLTQDNSSSIEPAQENEEPFPVEIIPIMRRNSHTEVIVGSHTYPGQGTYLLRLDNSYSLLRSKTVYYRIYYTT